MMDLLSEIAKKYWFFGIGGLIGAIIQRIRANEKVSVGKFIGSIVVSVFVALCVGVVCRDYLGWPDSLTYVCCGVSGVFAENILDEIQETIGGLSEWLKNLLWRK